MLKAFDDSPIKEEDEEQYCSDLRVKETVVVKVKKSYSMKPIDILDLNKRGSKTHRVIEPPAPTN